MTSFQPIEQLLRQAIGLEPDSLGASMVASAVQARLKRRGLKSVDDYAALVQSSEAEFQALVEEVVVPETWFFRDQHPFDALGSWAVETWLPAHPRGVMRLLSMPCSTGEEPYSMAMALLQAGVPEDRFAIEAVDISAVVLARARLGVYGKNSFRGHNLSFREHYFRSCPEGWRLNEEVRRLVHFRQTNLLEPAFVSSLSMQDVVFCRNTLIYFHGPAQRQAMALTNQILSSDGLLFVGHAEAYIFSVFGFESARLPMAFAFRKAGYPALPITARSQRQAPRVSIPKPPPPKKAAPLRAPEPPQQPATPPNKPKDLEVAQQLADSGQLEAAMKQCRLFLDRHGPTSHGYYLLGLLNDASGQIQEASDCYHKTLYLEPDHDEALAHLALLEQRAGNAGIARQLQQRARRAHARQNAQAHHPA